MSEIRAGLCSLAMLALPAFSAHAAPGDDVSSLGNYAIKHWTTQDGLPQNSIRDIVQTPDGRMWFATWEGLVSYDGLDFHVQNRGSDPALPDNGIGALTLDAVGDMWFSDSRGDVGRHDSDGSWHFWPHEASAPSTIVQSMKVDRHDDVWMLYENHGLGTMSHSGRFHYLTPGHNEPLSSIYRNMAFDASDSLWLGTYSGIIIRDKDGHVRQPPASWDLPHGLSWPYHAPDGTFWIVSDSRIFSIADNKPRLAYDLRDQGRVTALLQDRHGSLWVGTEDHGLLRLSGNRVEVMPDTLDPTGGRILSLAEDTEGSIWVGTNAGLFRLQETPFSSLRRHNGLSGDFVRTVMEDHTGALWVGTDGGLSRIINGDSPETMYLPTRSGHQPEVLSSIEDHDGTVWLGTYADGLFAVAPDGTIRHLDSTSGLPAGNVRALAFDSNHSLIVGTQRGLFRLMPGDKVERYAASKALSGLITAIFTKGDTLWIGTLDGVRVIRDGKVRAIRFSGVDGAHTIFGFVAIGDDLWLTTDRGLYRYRQGRMTHIGRDAGLPVDSVFTLIRDNRGYLWLTSNRGLFRIALTDLEAVADGRRKALSYIQLDETNGLSSSQASGSAQPSAALARDGTLWIATAIGLAKTDTNSFDKFLVKPPPPPVALDGVALDGRDIHDLRKGDVLHVPSRHNLTIRYTAPSYIAPKEILFRTTITGAGSAWTTAGRSRTLELTSLPPGAYTLTTSAAHPGQVWPRPVTLVRFVIDPKWWQRRQFWVSCAVALCIVIALSYWGIVWSYRAEANRLARVIRSRTTDLEAQTREKDALLARLEIQIDLTARQAREDALTGVYNRRAFDEAVEKMLTGANTGGPDFCLAIVDIDHFKAINDTYSHQTGDQVLRQVAHVLETHTHPADMVARIGGEEFGILLPAQTLETAIARLDGVREAFHEKTDWEISRSTGLVTFSAGLTRFEAGDTIKTLMKRADLLLYEAKNAGRDRIHNG
ncbi:ligand-binding sensor domain-containing diguanylate cyclase [Asaia bogorensis]|uniref:ligand-binding sensor domain-containing diguanylate cyclase n=1 Tax=Asaia bogorensis TaxID=91915 RepID=UPI0028636E59|nr:diguanylate cyclase [Asaia bogorensis]MDR6181618.1 diguanylate cyclase (GGDEF)-like protein [Asaia bogorensis NBRC 16594]